jgi:hypothetical protein
MFWEQPVRAGEGGQLQPVGKEQAEKWEQEQGALRQGQV